MRTRAAFSLVELAIVVAIIGILAALAIPTWQFLQLRARRAELPANVAGIKQLEKAYEVAHDEFLAMPVTPRDDGALDKEAVTWVETSDWTQLGWRPDGRLRGNYRVSLSTTPDVSFTVVGRADLDDDGTLVEYTATDLVAATITAGTEDVF